MSKKNLVFILSLSVIILTSGIQKQLKGQENGKTIDKIVAIVGDNVILHSDIENQYMQYVMQGYTQKGEIHCQIFEELLFQKMLLNKAEVDSITVTPSQVNSELDRRMRYFIRQIGSPEKLEEYYNKSIVELKDELRGSIREQLLVSQVQRTLTDEITITPSEVKDFFNELPKDSLPVIPQQFQIAEITLVPEVSHEDEVKIKTRLRELRERIINGSSFKLLAELYSEDPGSAEEGGELGMFTKGEMYPEFEEAAFKLEVGEVSPIVETEAGFHIIQMIDREGEYINVRHILLMKKVSGRRLMEAQFELDSIRNMIREIDTLTFAIAAREYSDTYDETSAGIVLNPQTGSTKFSPEEMEKQMYFAVDDLEEGEISEPVSHTTQSGAKAIRIYKMLEKTEPHRANLDDDYDKIKSSALERKKSLKIKDWVNTKSKETFIKVLDDRYKQCDFTYNWFE